ncbi:MAG: YihY/virulence factor BrkB family protein [Terracoccus sp.]
MATKERLRTRLEELPGALPLARLTMATIRVCMRYRVTGLASEGAFFMLLSLPPLVLGLFGGIGYVGSALGPESVERVVQAVQTYAEQFLTASSVTDLVLPTIDDVLRGGRLDLISVGFLLSLWSGSRALNVFVDTISIMYGQSGARGIIRMRAFSLGLYAVAIFGAILVLPLTLLGPSLLASWMPGQAASITQALYWPTLLLLGLLGLTSLYHIATPRRSPWLRDLPGAALAVAIWVGASYVVRISIEASLGGGSIYGPLSAPIVLLIWLYALAIAILIGAGLNAAARVLWPVRLRDGAGTRLINWVQDGAGGLLSRGSETAGREEEATYSDREIAEDRDDPKSEQLAHDRQYSHGDRGPIGSAVERTLEDHPDREPAPEKR